MIRGESEAESRSSAAVWVTAAVLALWLWLPGSATARAFAPVGPGPATHFVVAAPSPVVSYTNRPLTVTAYDANNQVATGYAGTVHFTSTDPGYVNASGDGPLPGGTGTFNFALKTAGTQTITATDSVNTTITGTSGPITVVPGPTIRLIVTAPATATLGTPFSLTVRAADLYGNTTPAYTGTVHFTSSDPKATLPADATLTNGTGTFSATPGTIGSQTITVTDTANTAITATSNSVAVSADTTTNASGAVAVFSSSSTPVGLTATVTSNAGPVNAGTVTFTLLKNGTTPIGSPTTSNTVLNGAASAVYTLPAGTGVGTYTIQATYNAAGGFLTSSDSSKQLVINSASTTTAASNASAGYSSAGQTVNLSAAVTSGAGPVNEGTVTFTVMQGNAVIGSATTSATVANGNASVSYTLPAGQATGLYTINAVYNAGADFSGSSESAHTLNIGPSATTTTASNASIGFSHAARSVFLSATVAPPAGAVNEGTVTFTVTQGGTVVGSPTTSTAVGNGNASVVYALPADLSAGTYTIDAVYNPGADFVGSEDATHTLRVFPAPTRTVVPNATTTYSVAAHTVTLSATVTLGAQPVNAAKLVVVGGGPVNEGTVTFRVFHGPTLVGSATTSGTVTGGNASVDYPLPAVTGAGSYSIRAAYNPGPDFSASGVSEGPTLTVTPAATTTAAADTSTAFSTAAQNVTLSATVTSPAGAVGEGSVTFTVLQGGTTIGSATTSDSVIGGAASVSYPLPAGTTPGSYTIQATYSPGPDFIASGDSAHALSVLAAPTVSITTPANGAAYTVGQVVTASYTCTDAPGAPGIESCVVYGAPLDTSHPGTYEFVVKATSKDGQTGYAVNQYSVLKAPTALQGKPLIIVGPAKDRHANAKANAATTPTAKVTATLTRPDTGAGVPGETIQFTAPQGGQLCQATTDASGTASCTFALTPVLASALSHGYGVSFAGDADYLPASVTVAPGGQSAKVTPTKVSVSPRPAHICQAELNGKATTSRVTKHHPLCDQLWVTVTGTTDQTAGGQVTVTMNGGWSALKVRSATTTASVTGGRWQARLLVYGRNHEPGDRWTIKIAYTGDGAHGAATTSREVMIEAEGPGNPTHERG